MKKRLTIMFFQADFDLEKYLGAVIGQGPNSDLSVPTRSEGKLFQFRNVVDKGEDIYGRMCQIRLKGKPYTTRPDTSEEKEIKWDLIEGTNFRYHKKNRVLLIQQNSHVVGTDGMIGTFVKMLEKINEGNARPDGGYSFEICYEKEARDKILQGKSDVSRVMFNLSKEDALAVVAKKRSRIGLIKSARSYALQVSFDLRNANKIKAVQEAVESEDEDGDAVFYIKGQPFNLVKDFQRKERIVCEIPEATSKETASEVEYKAIYAALADIYVRDIT